MKVSVLIVAYNVEKYINRCIKSVINQTMKDIEIIIVNDGSTDNTEVLINEFNDKRIKLITQHNKGVMETRKAALNEARGEYILFLDGDDWIEEHTLETLYTNAKEENTDIVMYNAKKVYDNGDEFDFWGFNENRISEIKEDPLKELFIGNVLPCIWSKFIKLEFLKSNNIKLPSNLCYAEDLAICSVILANNPSVSLVKDKLYNYYTRNNSLTNNINEKFLDVYKALDFIKSTLINYNMFEKYKQEYEYLLFMHGFLNLMKPKDKELHNKAYELYMKEQLDIEDNSYILQFKNKHIFNKILIFCYEKSCSLGRFYYKKIYLNLFKIKSCMKI